VRASAVRFLAAAVAAVAVAFLICGAAHAPTRGAVTVLLTGGRPVPPGALPVAAGLALLVLARGIAGGRRLALYGLAVALAAAGALPGAAHRPARLVVGATVVGLLLALYRLFPVRPHPRRLRTSVHIGLAGIAAALLHDLWPVHGATGRALGLLALACAVAALAVALAAAPPPVPGDESERALVAAFAAHPGADSLAPFASRMDKTYAFSPDHRAAVGYRVLFGTALVGGDPVGAPDAAGAAVAEYLDTCARNGWRPAVLGASTGAVDLWRAHGVRRGVVIGDEAVLDVAGFSLESRRMRNVRQAVQRTGNAGLTVHIGRLTADRARELAPVLRDWLRGGPERGFAMILDHLLVPRPDCLVAVAYDRRGRPQAFARFAWCAAGRVLTLDVAPRRATAPNGVVERLVVDVLSYGRERGVAELSLNFAGLRGVFDARTRPARLAAGLAHLLDRWIELWPLYRFTAKFHPRWRPRSVLMRSWWAVGWVLAAALRAEFGRSRYAENGELGELAPEPATA
jgi:lysyl-tRNA synthetase class 2